jgi:hypothetical protein
MRLIWSQLVHILRSIHEHCEDNKVRADDGHFICVPLIIRADDWHFSIVPQKIEEMCGISVVCHRKLIAMDISKATMLTSQHDLMSSSNSGATKILLKRGLFLDSHVYKLCCLASSKLHARFCKLNDTNIFLILAGWLLDSLSTDI